MREQSKSQSQ